MPITATELLGGAAIFTTIGLVWNYIKLAFSRLFGLFFVTVKMSENMSTFILEPYLVSNFKKICFQPRIFKSHLSYVKPVEKRINIGTEHLDNKLFFLKGWRPLFYNVTKADPLRPTSSSENNSCSCSLIYIRGTFDIEEMLIEALDSFNEKTITNIPEKKNRFYIRRHFSNDASQIRTTSEVAEDKPSHYQGDIEKELWIGSAKLLKWNINDIGESEDNNRNLQVLAFPKEIEYLIEEITRWKNSEKWYKEKSIPWKRGYLLYGVPGTGKSSLVKALGVYLDLPIHIFDISTMSNMCFCDRWSEMLSKTPCIALIEDIDTVFKGRQNVRSSSSARSDYLTFDCLLNGIDGINNTDGLLLMITTNRVEDLDEALGRPRTDKEPNGTMISTRPGRIDRAIELKILNKECRLKIANRILKDCPQYIESVIDKSEGFTGAQTQELCTQIALKYFWDNKLQNKIT